MKKLITLESTSHINEMRVIYSVDKASELSVVESYILDAKRVCADYKCPFHSVYVRERGLFQHEMEKIFERARDAKVVPLLQIIMHGTKDDGAKIGGEFMPWDTLIPWFRKINIKTRNCLIVLSSVCFSMQLALDASVTLPAPFYMLIAPQEQIGFQQFISQSLSFLVLLFKDRDAFKSYELSLEPSSRLYHSQEVLLRGLTGYLQKYVLGDGGQQRIANLVKSTQFRFAASLHEEAKKTLTEKANIHINNLEALITKYENVFLIGRNAGFSADDLLDFARENIEKETVLQNVK